MKKLVSLIIILEFILVSCTSKPPESQSEPNETVQLEQIFSTAVAGTLEAEKTQFSPPFPYTPAQLASLLGPGDDLEGRWIGSSVVDLTQPIEGNICGDTYDNCWQEWPGMADYGAELSLLHQGDGIGYVTLLYYQDLSAIDTIYEAYYDHWSSDVEDIEGLEPWMISFNKFTRPGLGDKWLHFIHYYLHDESISTDPAESQERELLGIQIVFFRCHGFVKLDLSFPPGTDWNDRDEMDNRIIEQEAFFNLVYEFASRVDERITPYACNEK